MKKTQADYREYLKTPHWDGLRVAALKRDGLKCTRCHQGDQVLQVHHTFYRKQWEDTQLHDLKTLCIPCHQRTHASQKRKSKRKKARTAKWHRKRNKHVRQSLNNHKREHQIWLSRKGRYDWSF